MCKRACACVCTCVDTCVVFICMCVCVVNGDTDDNASHCIINFISQICIVAAPVNMYICNCIT